MITSRHFKEAYPPRDDRKRAYYQCSRKKGFTTSREANAQIHRTLKKQGIKLNYYECPYCGKFHLTKKFVKGVFNQ